MKYLFPLLLMLCSCGYAQDGTNTYCGYGSVAQPEVDGPAQLPQRCMFTQISSTPSSNYPTYVGPASPAPSLPMVLSTAQPGAMIVVDPGSVTQVAGKLTSQSGDCANQQWITVKSASALLPDEYTRVNPSFAAQMPKIILTAQNATLIPGSCTRWIGIEVTRPAGTGVVYDLITMGGSHDVILDRDYIHGTVTDETNRGLELSDSYNVAVINSYFSGFQCRALTGACGDSQAIAGGTSGTVQDGNFKIVNNYLEAAGENVIFGGGGANFTPQDILVAYNDIAKLPNWNPQDPSFDGGTAGKDGVKHPWIVKNHIEMKNANRVLIEGNRLQYVWGGFTQVGASVLLTPKNQAGANGTSVCPICEVTNVTVRFNYGSYAGQALQLGCGPNDLGGWPAGCGNDSLHDNVFDHLQYGLCYLCGSFTNLIGGGSSAVPFHDVTVANNTFQNDGWLTPATDKAATMADGALNAGGPLTGNANIHFDNNIFDPGNFGVYSTGGGLTNCWSTPGTIAQHAAQCWPGGSMTGNQFTTTIPYKGSAWPAGNGTNPSAGANMSLVNAALAHRH